MMTVWKSPLDLTDRQSLKLPASAKILWIAPQRDQLCVWFLCNPALDKTTRTFRIVGTGHEIKYTPRLEYIASFQLAGGDLMFHVFEEMP